MIKFLPKLACFTLLFWLLISGLQAQSVGINTASPDATSVLDINSNNKGMLPPRLTSTQRDAIASPALGLMIFNLTTKCMEYWNGTEWISTCATTAPCSKPPTSTAGGNTPVCQGSTLSLTATPVVGATYVWSGPAGFSSTTQNPSIAAVDATKAGVYTLRTWMLGCYSDPDTINVTVTPNPWVQKASFPATKRGDPVIFGVNGKAYMGGGYDGSTYYSDFYEYNPTTNTWTAKAAVAGPLRYAPSSWATTSFGYCAGGFHSPTATVYSNVYQYDPAANTWAAKTALPSTLVHADVTVANTVPGGYVLGGKYNSGPTCASYSNSMYIYNEAGNSWSTQTWAYPRRAYPITIWYGGLMYWGAGTSWDSCVNSYSDWYSYNPTTGVWTVLASYPGTAGSKQAYFETGGYLYVIDNNLSIYRYSPTANTWTKLPCNAPIAGYTAVIGGKAYLFDTGNTRQTWEFNP